MRLSDSASLSLCSNILVFSVASAVTAAICFSLFTNAAPSFSFCKLSLSIRVRTSLISRDSRTSSRAERFGFEDCPSVWSPSSASSSWSVSSARSCISCLLSSSVKRFESSAFSSLSVSVCSSFLSSSNVFSALSKFVISSFSLVSEIAFSSKIASM